jgi:hypothetical protein
MIEVGSLLSGETSWTPLFACGVLVADCPFACCCRQKFWCSSDLWASRDVHNFLANRKPVSPANHRVRSDFIQTTERQHDGLLLLLRSNDMDVSLVLAGHEPGLHGTGNYRDACGHGSQQAGEQLLRR